MATAELPEAVITKEEAQELRAQFRDAVKATVKAMQEYEDARKHLLKETRHRLELFTLLSEDVQVAREMINSKDETEVHVNVPLFVKEVGTHATELDKSLRSMAHGSWQSAVGNLIASDNLMATADVVRSKFRVQVEMICGCLNLYQHIADRWSLLPEYDTEEEKKLLLSTMAFSGSNRNISDINEWILILDDERDGFSQLPEIQPLASIPNST